MKELSIKEIEDEKIIKHLITLFKHEYGENSNARFAGIKVKDIIAWLEKKGEATDINPSEFDLRLNKLLKQFETLPKEELASSLSFYLNVVQNNGTYKEEKQGEQETLCDKCRKAQPSHSCQDITALGRCALEKKDEQKSTDTQKSVEWEPQTGDTFRKKGTTSPTYHLCEKQEDSIIFNFVENREVGISGGEITLFALKRDYELVERPKSIEDVVEEELNKALQTKAEQKPTIETKLKIEKGKWYVCISQFCNCIEGRVYKAISDNRIIDDFGTEYDMHDDAYKWFRPWTIQDAKDGDVLTSGEQLFLFKRMNTSNSFYAHCSYHFIGYDSLSVYDCSYSIDNIYPATKEQRDTLMKAMADARYTFDFEKKELKKVEQKHTKWSDTDYVMQRAALEILMASPKTVASTILKESVIVWLQSLKNRLQPKQDSTDRFFEGFKKGEQSVLENYGKYGLCKLTEWRKHK